MIFFMCIYVLSQTRIESINLFHLRFQFYFHLFFFVHWLIVRNNEKLWKKTFPVWNNSYLFPSYCAWLENKSKRRENEQIELAIAMIDLFFILLNWKELKKALVFDILFLLKVNLRLYLLQRYLVTWIDKNDVYLALNLPNNAYLIEKKFIWTVKLYKLFPCIPSSPIFKFSI